MICPYCQNKMIEGFISGDRYALKWKEGKWPCGLSKKKIVVKLSDVLSGNYVPAYYCSECEKIVINILT